MDAACEFNLKESVSVKIQKIIQRYTKSLRSQHTDWYCLVLIMQGGEPVIQAHHASGGAFYVRQLVEY